VAARLFRFVQLEVPWPLGPADGRYVVRGHAGEAADHVLVLATLGAPQRRLLARGRERAAEPVPPPTPVSTGRATVIPAAPLEGHEAAREWLERADREAELAAALAVLERALHSHRVAAADPGVRSVGRAAALVARLGFGEGEEVAEGRWTEAVELAAPRPGRQRGEAALRPQERLAALLGGRDAALACEALVLRARADLDAGRPREAALQLRVALEAALAELAAWRDRGDMAARLEELADARPAVGAAANAALAGGLPPDAAEAVAQALGRLEAALRSRSAAGFA
jgi:hypothetical protein